MTASAHAPSAPSGVSASSATLAVELRAARIPVIGAIAHHHWFVVEHDDPTGRRDRWEVWQYADFGGERSVGHLHKNLLPADAGVGSGPSWIIARWGDEAAKALAERIEGSFESYPWCRKYRYWPGPNSNTYAQWILGEQHLLGRCGVGRRYCRPRSAVWRLTGPASER
jgi:hypothetical protein